MKRINGGRSQRQYMLWAFKLSGCHDCGIRPPDIALEDLACHHKDPTTKVTTGSRSLTKRNDGLLGHNSHDELLGELTKCVVLCRDCHGRRHKGTHTLAEQQPLFIGNRPSLEPDGGFDTTWPRGPTTPRYDSPPRGRYRRFGAFALRAK